MKEIDFKTSGYFSGSIIFFGVVLAMAGLGVLFKSAILGLILLLVSVIIFTTHYRLKIDFDTKVFHDYVWILGLKNGDQRKFENIEYLFIKKSLVSQTMNSLLNSSTFRKHVYDGYLKFSEKDKIHLITKDSKNDLIEKLRVIASRLNVRIVDYSAAEPKEI
jgi:hypothetical protein